MPRCARVHWKLEVYRTFGCISPLRYFAHIAKEINHCTVPVKQVLAKPRLNITGHYVPINKAQPPSFPKSKATKIALPPSFPLPTITMTLISSLGTISIYINII